MENKHFVYCVDCGTYDAEGYPIRTFGISTTRTFAERLRSYKQTAAMPPVLCGAIPCETRKDAKILEQALLHRFSESILPNHPDSESRRGTPDVLNFIDTEMMNGEDFLGMPTEAYRRHRTAESARERYQTDDAYREKRQRLEREKYATDTTYREKKAAWSKEHQKKPEIREKRNQQTRLRRQRKKRGGNASGQTSFLP